MDNFLQTNAHENKYAPPFSTLNHFNQSNFPNSVQLICCCCCWWWCCCCAKCPELCFSIAVFCIQIFCHTSNSSFRRALFASFYYYYSIRTGECMRRPVQQQRIISKNLNFNLIQLNVFIALVAIVSRFFLHQTSLQFYTSGLFIVPNDVHTMNVLNFLL